MITTLNELYALAWPASRLAEAMEALAVRSGLNRQSAPAFDLLPDTIQIDADQIEQWAQRAAAQLNIEAEPVAVVFRDVDGFVRNAGPALIRLVGSEESSEPVFLAFLKGGMNPAVLTPDLRQIRIKQAVVSQAIRRPILQPVAEQGARFLTNIGISEERREKVGSAIYQELFGSVNIQAGWLLRLPPGAPMIRQMAQAHLLRPVIAILVAQLLIQALTLLAWGVVGKQALAGSFENIWLVAWGLLLFTVIPFQMWLGISAGSFSTGLGSIFKQRLIHGTLSLKLDEIRHEGMGQFLGRVIDSDVVQSATIGNGFTIITAFIQMLSALSIFFVTGSWQAAVLLVIWTVLTVGAGAIYYLIAHDWYAAYRLMTNNLVEGMIGHRTRLAQQTMNYWHVEEDNLLSKYLMLSQQLDRISNLQNVISGAWLTAGLINLALISATTSMPLKTVVISLGGILLAQQALQMIRGGINSTASGLLAWQQVNPLFRAARRVNDTTGVALFHSDKVGTNSATQAADSLSPVPEPKALLTIKNLSFRYRDLGRWVLQDCTFTVYAGNRILLEGPSGGGKTTLGALIAGLREPVSGLLLLRGYDQKSLGVTSWRRHIVVAPQFHENYIFTETFAFNLLMGRRYPPTQADLHDAAQICEELGLGELVKRMPSGFQQMVGESGWQLSHGERSRVFIARALLQNAEIIILDESFGALDAETLQQALECVLKRARTLIVIAHP